MIIGNFMYTPSTDSYCGEIITLTFERHNVQLLAVKKSSDKEPDYRVSYEGEKGTVEFGAAWKRVSEKGQIFLSVTLDDPSLNIALNTAMFTSDEDEAVLVWSRRSKDKAEPAAKPDKQPLKRNPKAK